MTITSSYRTVTHKPKDYDEFFRMYYSYVVNLVQKNGILRENAEDVTMSILTTFFEKDVLSQHDENYHVSHGGQKAKFRTHLSGFVLTYLRHHRDRQKVRLYREGFSGDAVVAVSDSGETFSWMDFNLPAYVEDHSDLHTSDLVSFLRTESKKIRRSNRRDTCDFPLLLDMMVLQIEEQGKLDFLELSEMFSVSVSTMRKWVERLRDNLSEVAWSYLW